MTSSMHVNHRPDPLKHFPSEGERENSNHRHQVDHLIRRPEDTYSDVPHRSRIEMLGQPEASVPFQPQAGNAYKR